MGKPKSKTPNQNHEERIPDEFFCAYSDTFLTDPVIDPTSKLVCNRQSLHEHQPLQYPQPNLILRKRIHQWLSPFKSLVDVICPKHLEASIARLLENRDLDLLLKFKTELQNPYKSHLLKRWGVYCVAKLLYFTYVTPEYTATAVSILAYPPNDERLSPPPNDDFYDLLYCVDHYLVGSSIDVCGGKEFQMGMVNLIHSFVDSTTEEFKQELIYVNCWSLQLLVDNVWPIRRHLALSQCYQRLLSTLKSLANNHIQPFLAYRLVDKLESSVNFLLDGDDESGADLLIKRDPSANMESCKTIEEILQVLCCNKDVYETLEYHASSPSHYQGTAAGNLILRVLAFDKRRRDVG